MIKMKKTLLLSALAIGLLTSCSKEDNCNQAFESYDKEISMWIAPLNREKVSEINSNYHKLYPNCGFPEK
jgi:hypothetical protein